MDDGFEERFRALREWTARALAEGWISIQDSAPLDGIEQQQAAALFAQRGRRPLIVSFFGGTGVGKSSLLNRLAGQGVARVGLQRPTSSEVTLYLHQDCALGELPAELPLQETRIAYHQDDSRRLVAWLDMPDFDSVEGRHRELVKLWLPYVDWVVYVVSPGRYLDDIGWRFLQQRGSRHAWLFVMNQWDQGSPAQVEHLRTRLQQEGFHDPTILCTSCNPQGTTSEDDFHLLEQTINDAIQKYGLELLQQLGTESRLRELHRLSGQLLEKLRHYPVERTAQSWNRLLTTRLGELEQELMNNGMLMFGDLPESGGGWPWRPAKARQGPPPVPPADLLGKVWGARMDTRIGDLASELENLVVTTGVPIKPFSATLDRLRQQGREDFSASAEGELASAYSGPDRGLRTLAYALSGQLSWALPAAAAGWAVYHALTGYYAGTQGEGDFLGIDFAIHSCLLIGLSWLLPWLIQRKLSPSMADRIIRALRVGVGAGIARLEKQGSDGVQSAATELREQVTRLLAVREGLEQRQSETAPGLPWRRQARG